MTLNDPYPQFQGDAILWRWISQKPYEIQTVQWNINRDLRPTQHCHFEWPWVTLNDLAEYSMTRSVARPLCDSWASCFTEIWWFNDIQNGGRPLSWILKTCSCDCHRVQYVLQCTKFHQNRTIFAARCYPSAALAVMLCPCVCVCVCVCSSVTFVDSVETSNRIVRLFFHHRVDPSFQSRQYSDVDPPNGGVECKGA